jgi:hypothetical protein
MYVQQPYAFLNNQFDALIYRCSQFDDSKSHKCYNHCGRVLYILLVIKYLNEHKLFKRIPTVHDFQKIPPSMYNSLLKKIKKAGTAIESCQQHNQIIELIEYLSKLR